MTYLIQMSMGSLLVEAWEHSRGKTEQWIMETLIQLIVRKIRSWGGRVSGLKQYSGQLLGGTGWWLRASWSVNALAKEAEVQGNAPARAGTGMPVKKPGRSPGLERTVLSGAAQDRRKGRPGKKGQAQREAVVQFHSFGYLLIRGVGKHTARQSQTLDS